MNPDELLDYYTKSIRWMLWPNRHRGILPYEGGFVEPRDEIRRQLRIIRTIRAEKSSFMTSEDKPKQLYLIVCGTSNMRARFLRIDTAATSGDEFGELQKEFAGKDWPMCDIYRLYDDQCINGVYYDYELASSSGASFLLFQWPGIDDDMIAKAKKRIKDDHDVVRLKVCKIVTVSYPELVHQ